MKSKWRIVLILTLGLAAWLIIPAFKKIHDASMATSTVQPTREISQEATLRASLDTLYSPDFVRVNDGTVYLVVASTTNSVSLSKCLTCNPLPWDKDKLVKYVSGTNGLLIHHADTPLTATMDQWLLVEK